MVFGLYVLGVGPSYRTLKSQITHKYEGFLIPQQFSRILNKGMKTTCCIFFVRNMKNKTCPRFTECKDSGRNSKTIESIELIVRKVLDV